MGVPLQGFYKLGPKRAVPSLEVEIPNTMVVGPFGSLDERLSMKSVTCRWSTAAAISSAAR